MAQYRKDTYRYLDQEKTLFEVVMIADQYGNLVGPSNPSGMAVDAFGRARSSEPLTLFDSTHRYRDNGKIGTSNSASGSSVTHDANSSSVLCSVNTANGSYVYRESSKVFSYQPGKSLQILQTFVMAPAQTNLRQRYGYFNTQNGVFLEQKDNVINFVRRSSSTGTLTETRVAQADWNVDPLDGTGPSGYTLDLTKAQILFHDIEWLGVGSVRAGFVINGQFIHCHTWNHANVANNTYMTTGSLPVRAEIENTGTTGNTSNLRIICTSVISEGGYEARGLNRTVSRAPNSVYTLTTAGVYYPVASIRLKSETPDAIVVPKSVALLGVGGNGTRISWKLVSGANVSGGTWTSADANSSVQYNYTGTSMDGGIDHETGYLYVSQQGSASLNMTDDLFRMQLERNSFTGTNSTFTLAVAGAGNGDTVLGSINWMEIT